MNLLLKKITPGMGFNKTSVLTGWLALFLSVCIGVMAFYTTAFMPCHKEKSCTHPKTAARDACPVQSSHTNVKPCKLTKMFTISESNFKNNPAKKLMQLKIDSSAALFCAELSKTARYFYIASKYTQHPGKSPSIFLLKSSFLC